MSFMYSLESQYLNDIIRLNSFLSPNVDTEDATIDLSNNVFSISKFNTKLMDCMLNNNFVNDKHFSCIHINCRSLSKNHENLISFLSCLDIKPTIIGLTETWISESTPCAIFNIDGYKFVGLERKNKRGGGVGFYIRNNVEYTHVREFDIIECHIEGIFLELRLCNTSIYVASIYRLPGQPIGLFVNSLCAILDKINISSRKLYLLGDYNIDLLKVNRNFEVNTFLDTLISYSLNTLIRYPTRVTEHSATLLDNIFTNDESVLLSGALFSDISDHFPVFCLSKGQEIDEIELRTDTCEEDLARL